jgi:hypothetical protein
MTKTISVQGPNGPIQIPIDEPRPHVHDRRPLGLTGLLVCKDPDCPGPRLVPDPNAAPRKMVSACGCPYWAKDLEGWPIIRCAHHPRGLPREKWLEGSHPEIG